MQYTSAFNPAFYFQTRGAKVEIERTHRSTSCATADIMWADMADMWADIKKPIKNKTTAR